MSSGTIRFSIARSSAPLPPHAAPLHTADTGGCGPRFAPAASATRFGASVAQPVGSGGRTRIELTRINIALTVLRKKIEELMNVKHRREEFPQAQDAITVTQKRGILNGS